MTNINSLADLRQQLHADRLCSIGTLRRRYGLDPELTEPAILNADRQLIAANDEEQTADSLPLEEL